jgi:predicted LPLAT superfamily acyltransferase
MPDMPQWKGRSKGNKLGYRIFVFICSRFGLRPAYLLLRFVAFYYLIFSWSSTRPLFQYFRLRMGYSILKSVIMVYRNYYVFGQTLLDKIMVMAGIRNEFTYHFDGEENLQEIVQKRKGGILLSAHVGNWEAAGHFLNRLETRINIVMFDGEQRAIKQYLDQVTGTKNFKVIVIKNDLSHVYAIGDALAKNELICLHADRFLEGNKTIQRKLLGVEALFPYGPFSLANGFNVPVSIVFGFKESSTHYHLYGSKPIIRAASESKSEFIERLVTTFVNELEGKIRMYPAQWFNYYNFWNN